MFTKNQSKYLNWLIREIFLIIQTNKILSNVLINYFNSIFQLNGATYAANLQSTAGGVGRNIADGICKLYGGAHLISAVGDDQVS